MKHTECKPNVIILQSNLPAISNVTCILAWGNPMDRGAWQATVQAPQREDNSI